MLDKLDLNTKAQELRELLGEDASSPVDIFSLANQIDGLTLVFYPLGENISGMCVRDNEIKLITRLCHTAVSGFRLLMSCTICITMMNLALMSAQKSLTLKVRMRSVRISLPPTSSHHTSL